MLIGNLKASAMATDKFELSTVLGEFKDRSASDMRWGCIFPSLRQRTFRCYPQAWLEYYSQAGLLMQDPTVSCALKMGVCRWSDMDDPQVC